MMPVLTILRATKNNSKLPAVLAKVARDRRLSKDDRAHVERWTADHYPDDPIWRRLATAARERGLLPLDGIYKSIIREALYMRGRAEGVRSGVDFVLREQRQQYQRHLDLAQKAEDLAEYYKWVQSYSGIANFFAQFLQPVSDLEALHRKQAELLRQRAGRTPKPSVRVSRQDKSKGREGLRKIRAFINLANGFIHDWISDKPDHEAIALLTEIAFPDYVLCAEDVRLALRPTTLSARKVRSSGTRPK